MRFSVYQVSRKGGRDKNEDRMGYCYTRDAGLFALADGMGGHPEGEVASQLALQTLAALFQRDAKPTLAEPLKFLHEAIIAGHHQLAVGILLPELPPRRQQVAGVHRTGDGKARRRMQGGAGGPALAEVQPVTGPQRAEQCMAALDPPTLEEALAAIRRNTLQVQQPALADQRHQQLLILLPKPVRLHLFAEQIRMTRIRRRRVRPQPLRIAGGVELPPGPLGINGEIPIWASLVIIVGTLAVTTIASLMKSRKDARLASAAAGEGPGQAAS